MVRINLFVQHVLTLSPDFPYHYKPSDENSALTAQSTKFPELDDDAFAVANRPRIPPPKKSFDFLPDLMEKNEGGYKPRDDIKPLHIVQPEGVSFKMNGHELEWQNWKMHICKAELPISWAT